MWLNAFLGFRQRIEESIKAQRLGVNMVDNWNSEKSGLEAD